MIPRRDIRIFNSSLMREFLSYIFEKNRGSDTSFFKNSLGDYFNNHNIFLLGRGRQALHLAIDSVDYNAGDEIIIPNYYLKALISLLKSKGLEVVFCDINEKTLSNDLDDTLNKINNNTKFIILSHMFGVCQDIEKFIKKAKEKKKDIIIIEDCAHGFGSEYKLKKLGLFGDFSFFSFNYIKNINTLEGGAMIVNNKKYLERARDNYKNYTYPSKIDIFKKIINYYVNIIVFKIPFLNFLKKMLKKESFKQKIKRRQGGFSKNNKKEKISLFLSFIGQRQLKRFVKKQQRLEKVLKWYKKYLSSNVWKRRVTGENSKYSNYYLVFLIDKEIESVRDVMEKKGIDIGIKDEIMDICDNSGTMNNSLNVFNSAIQIPLYFSLKKRDVKKIAESLNKIL